MIGRISVHFRPYLRFAHDPPCQAPLSLHPPIVERGDCSREGLADVGYKNTAAPHALLFKTKSRNRIRPTRSFVPPRRASALALSLAQTTTPHILLPHGWARTCTLSCGFFHTPKEARCASTDADVASSSMAANTKLNLIAILPQGRIIICATFSAIAMVGALVLPDTIDGMIDASTTRKPSMPRTRAAGSTTDAKSLPMRHVPTG